MVDPTRHPQEELASTGPEPVREYRGTGVFWWLLLAFLAGLAVIVALAQNVERVDFEFLWLDASVPLFVLLLVAAALGAAITEGVAAWWRHQRRRVRTERSELRRLRTLQG